MSSRDLAYNPGCRPIIQAAPIGKRDWSSEFAQTIRPTAKQLLLPWTSRIRLALESNRVLVSFK